MRTRMNHCHKVDVDRLHAVLEGKLDDRGCGKTYATVHRLAMQIAGGDYPAISYGVHFLHFFKDYLLDIIRDVFPIYNLDIDWDKSTLQRLHVINTETDIETTVYVKVRGMNTTGLIRGPKVEIDHDCEIPEWRR